MAGEQVREGTFSLETVLAKILDFNAGRSGDSVDSLLLLSLLNLLGIISLLNKQAASSGAQEPAALGPLAGMLLNLLAGMKQEGREGGPEAGQGPVALPAALAGLLGAQQPGQGKPAPNPAALFKLFEGLAGNPGGLFPPGGGAGQPAGGAGAEAAGSEKVKEIKEARETKKEQGPLKWDARF
jgi:hypothetical protein